MFKKISYINTLVEQGYDLQVWNNRYGGGVRAMLGDSYHIDAVREASSDGDFDALPSMEYFDNTEWMPMVIDDKDCISALLKLEKRLANIFESIPSNENKIWHYAVTEACKHFDDIYYNKKGDMEDAEYDGTLGKLPATLKEMLDKKTANPEGDIWIQLRQVLQ